MKCPFCSFLDSKVTDSRVMDGGSAIRRRRVCDSCGKRFTTYERLDEIQLTVVKRDGTRETFDSMKIFNSIIHACDKRKVTADQITEVVSEIENHFFNSMHKEVSTEEIGELVMDKLKQLDEVAYVRFASVYRQFKDIDSFVTELTQLLKEKS